MKLKRILFILLCLVLVLSLAMSLVACSGGPGNGGGPGGGTGGGDDGGGKDDGTGGGPGGGGDDGGGKDDGGGNLSPGPGPGTSDTVDVTEIKAENFSIALEWGDSPFTTATDWYEGTFTEGLFCAGVEVYLVYDEGNGSRTELLEWETEGIEVTCSSDRVSTDMTFSIGPDALRDLLSGWTSEYDRSEFEDEMEELAEDVLDASHIPDDQLDKLLSEIFGYTQFTSLVSAYSPEGVVMGTSEDFQLNELGQREPVTVTLTPEYNYEDMGFLLYSTLDLATLNAEDLEVAEYYIASTDSYEMLYVDFSIDGYIDVLEAAGLTVTDEGILIDESFLDAVTVNYSEGKKGIVCELSAVCPDGSEQKVEVYIQAYSPRVYYDLRMPETVYAPLCFENDDATYTFDVVVAGDTVRVSYTTSGSYIGYSSIVDQLPELFRGNNILPVNADSCHSAVGFSMPESVTMYVEDVPVNRYTATSVIKDTARFVFSYEGGYTTTLDKENSYCRGISYNDMVNSTLVLDTDSTVASYVSESSLRASDVPYTFDCQAQLTKATFEVCASVEIVPVYTRVELDSDSIYKIQKSYYVGDEPYVEPGGTVSVMVLRQFGGESEVGETLPLTADMIVGVDTTVADDGSYTRYLYVKVGDALSSPYIYHVKEDFITSIEADIPNFSLYIIGTSPDLSGATITAHYDSGKRIEDIPLTSSHLSELPTEGGAYELTVTYEGVTDTHGIDAIRVASASVYSGLAGKYLVGEKPVEVLIRVEFEANHLDYDYDIIELSGEELSSFDTAEAGAKSWSFSFAGASVQHSYEVISSAYLVYMIGEDSLSVQGIIYDEAEIPTDSGYIRLTSLSTLEIPAAIDGVPVTSIRAQAFRDMNMVSVLKLPDSITSIGNNAFLNMTALEVVNIPVGCTVGTRILQGCTNLRDVTIPGDIAYSSYFGTNYPTEVTLRIAEGSVTACVDFFSGIGEATISKVVIPSTLVDFEIEEGSTLFWTLGEWGHIGGFECAAGGRFSASDGVLFADDGKILYYYPESKTDVSYTVPDGTELVVYMAYNSYLKSLVIPASVTELGESIFRLDEALESVTFLGSLAEFPDGCFDGCESLVSLNIPDGLSYVGENCFAGTALKTIVLPDSVIHIGYNAFFDAKVEKLAIPSAAMETFLQLGEQNLLYLAEFAYDGSVGLSDIEAIKYFGRYPQNLNKIYIYGTEYFESGVSGNTGRTMSIYVDRSVTEVGYGWYDSTDTKYYFESSSVNGSSNVDVGGYNVSFSKWYLG